MNFRIPKKTQTVNFQLSLSAPSRFSAEKKSFLENFIATLVFMLERKILSRFFEPTD